MTPTPEIIPFNISVEIDGKAVDIFGYQVSGTGGVIGSYQICGSPFPARSLDDKGASSIDSFVDLVRDNIRANRI